jgi:hypothetical protein
MTQFAKLVLYGLFVRRYTDVDRGASASSTSDMRVDHASQLYRIQLFAVCPPDHLTGIEFSSLLERPAKEVFCIVWRSALRRPIWPLASQEVRV